MALDLCTKVEMQGEPSDEVLMQRARAGDRDAYATLFVRHRSALTAFLTRFLGNAARAEDIAQETFLALWTERLRFDPQRRFKVWLYVAARNRAINAHRSKQEFPLDESLISDSNPLESSARTLLKEAVQGALLALPDTQRLVIVLTVYEGFTYREAAQIMGGTEVAARVLAHRARQALQKHLMHWKEMGYEIAG